MGWDHGYHSRDVYPPQFHHQLAPNWLDFAALVKGHQPPRPQEGAPFHYLELGSGMGLGLCLLAALYPEGEFTGVDFQPDHIAHSRHLARLLALTNVRFLEADFVALHRDPRPLGFVSGDPGPYHYVAAHGIATWVVEPVQDALFGLASAAMQPGGLFYCSYNTFPGWLPLTGYQQLLRLELERSDPAQPGEAIGRSATTLKELLGAPDQPSSLADLLPSLREELESLRIDNIPYMLGEYATTGWQPLYVAEMHRRVARHKLRPLATATLPELFEELLPPGLRERVRQEPNPTVRDTLIDLACARGFRRDVFGRGSARLSGEEWKRHLAAVPLRQQETPAREDWSFATSFGELSVPAPVCLGMEAALADGPRTVADLAEAIGQPTVEVVRLAALLLHDQRIGLDRGRAGELARDGCARVNDALLQRMGEGWPYATLAAPLVGNGVGCGTIEALACLAADKAPLSPAAGRWLLERLDVLLSDPGDGGDQSGGENRLAPETILSEADAFLQNRAPALKSLGAWPARQPDSGEGERRGKGDGTAP